jgi:uncharacterized protein YggE
VLAGGEPLYNRVGRHDEARWAGHVSTQSRSTLLGRMNGSNDRNMLSSMPAPGALLCSLIAGLLLMSDMAEAQERRPERSVSVSATGSVGAEPDVAHISTGVVSEADTAREALSRNSATMKKLIDGLKGQSIAAKDIQTTSINVEPRYQQFKDGRPAVIAGYRVVNQVRIIARNLSKLGEVLDQAVTLGANQMGGIQFEVSNAETLKDEARKRAMENALRRAKLFAAGAGAEVGEVLSISEDVQFIGPRPVPMTRAMAAEAVPIERGTQMLEARVNVTWALK